MSRVCSSFEPVWLGGATGRGAKPVSETSRNAYFILESLSPPYEAAFFDQAVEEIAGGLTRLAGASAVIVDRLQ